MATHGWARCTSSHADVLRRGAWYPVVEETSDGQVVVQMEQQRLHVSRADVRFRSDPPDQWSIVVRTGVMRPTWSGVKVANTYAVCPHCRERNEFEGHPTTLECTRCHRSAPVDWSETC
jgi:hypothetical protein